MVTWNKTKIIATVGPVSASRQMLRKILRAGADVLRVNGAHGTPAEHINTIRLIRSVAKKENFPAAILFDLPGPKIRIGTLKKEPIDCCTGKTLILISGQEHQIDERIPVPMKNLSRKIKPGAKIFLNDGMIELRALRIKGSEIECKVISGGELKSHKGVNLPNTKLDIPSLSKKDKALLDTAIRENVDYVGLSFVRSSRNVIALKKILQKRAPHIRVVSKIEKPEALEDLDNIIEASDVIMVARGDLGIEMPPFKLPAIQRHIIMKCHIAGKPSITATQMLESMVNSKVPTRAEVTDVAGAVWEGSDAIMLSAETSIGKYPAAAVSAMAKIALETEKRLERPKYETAPTGVQAVYADAISGAANLLANTLKAKAIITPTRSGRTALFTSKQRPATQILAPTDSLAVARRMSLYWGVRAMIMPKFKNIDQLLKYAEKTALKAKLIKKGDIIVITSGAHRSKRHINRIVAVRKAGER